MGVIPLWVWCAAVYAVLLAWPLKQLWWRRRVLRDGSAIKSIGQRWARRSANGVILGEGTIRIAELVEKGDPKTLPFVVQLARGDFHVPAGQRLQDAHGKTRRRDGFVEIPGGTEVCLSISAFMLGDGEPLDFGAYTFSRPTVIGLANYGYNPANDIKQQLDRVWHVPGIAKILVIFTTPVVLLALDSTLWFPALMGLIFLLINHIKLGGWAVLSTITRLRSEKT
jgi:hypothetical protein